MFTELVGIDALVVRIVLAALTAFSICIFSGSWVIRQLSLMQIKQYIREEGPQSHHKKAGIPTMGGILIVVSVCASTIVWTDLSNSLVWIILFAMISFGGIGFVDDYMMQIRKHNSGLGAKQKLLLQITVAIVIIFLIYFLPGFDTKLKVPFFKNIFLDLDWMYMPFSVMVIVGASNAVNLTDGLDGMAIGAVIIAKIVYMLLAVIVGYSETSAWAGVKCITGGADLAVYCAAFVGSGLGFLWFNSHPAEVFMGDIGSLSIGASLGTIAILIKHEVLLTLVGGIFVLETASVMLQVGFFKITKGRRLFRMAPIHHHFELIGLSESKVVLRFWIVGLVFAFVAVAALRFG